MVSLFIQYIKNTLEKSQPELSEPHTEFYRKLTNLISVVFPSRLMSLERCPNYPYRLPNLQKLHKVNSLWCHSPRREINLFIYLKCPRLTATRIIQTTYRILLKLYQLNFSGWLILFSDSKARPELSLPFTEFLKIAQKEFLAVSLCS